MTVLARLLAVVLLCLPLAACIDIETVIKVRGDGSGTVVERMTLSPEAVEMIRQMEEMAKANGGTVSGGGMVERDKLAARAAQMGPGVKLVSAEELPAPARGYVAVWSFEDVDTLRVEQDAEGSMPAPQEQVEPTAGDKPSLSFRLERGETPVLHVMSSLAQGAAAAPPPAPAPAGEAAVPPEMIKEMFGGMRFELAVEVEGGIVETNAAHREAGRVTLMAIDFDRLLENDKALALLSSTDQPDPMQMQAALQGLPGIRVEVQPDVRIAFTPAGATTAEANGGAVTASAAGTASDAAASTPPAAGTDTASAGTATATAAVVSATGDASASLPAADVVAALPPMPAASGTLTGGAPELPLVPAKPLPTGSIAGYAWRPLAVTDIGAQVGKLVSITDSDGMRTKGLVMRVDADSVELRRASIDGGGSIDVPLTELRELAVFEQGG